MRSSLLRIGGILEGISLANDLVAALSVTVRVVHAMSEVGTSENEDLFITSDFQTADEKVQVLVLSTWPSFPERSYRQSRPGSGRIFLLQNLTASRSLRKRTLVWSRIRRSGTCPPRWTPGDTRGCSSTPCPLLCRRSCTRPRLCSSPG